MQDFYLYQSIPTLWYFYFYLGTRSEYFSHLLHTKKTNTKPAPITKKCLTQSELDSI